MKYYPEWEQARKRLADWWNGRDIGRPAMHISYPLEKPIEDIPEMEKPEGWVTDYSTKNLPYRINLALRGCIKTGYFAEAVPNYRSGDLGPGCLALYLGCHGVEMPETVWCEPCIANPQEAKFKYDPDNFYWKFSLEAYRRVKEKSQGKFLQHPPDFIEGLDTLAAMRGTETFLLDLVERPEWVHKSLRKITDLYFHYYDIIYDIIRDEVGGSVFWAWAPGRMAKFQCDFSAMISPGMFKEFMYPVLDEMTQRVSYSMYHWDGPGALEHLDVLLSVKNLDMLQWTPGAGCEQTWHKKWWDMYHKILGANKKIYLMDPPTREQLLSLKKEFGDKFKGMLINYQASDREDAVETLKILES